MNHQRDYQDELNRLPKGERDFAASWGESMVDILAVINFPTDATAVSRIQSLILPLRLVRPDDFNLARPSDLPFVQRIALIGMGRLHRFESLTGGGLRRLLERFVSDAEREALLAQVLERALAEAGEGIVGAILDAINPFASFTAESSEACADPAELACELARLRRLEAELSQP